MALNGSLDGLETRADILRLIERELENKAGSVPVNGVKGLPDQLQALRNDIDDLSVEGIPGGVFDAKGDILAGSANDAYDNFPAGANGTVLRADSTQTLGLIWAVLGISDITGLQSALDGKQPLDAELSAIAGLASAANQLPYFTGAGTAALTNLSALARTLLGNVDAGEMRATLSVRPGIDVQTQDAELQALAGLSSNANKLPYFDGIASATITDLSPFARTILAGANAGAVLTTLGAAALAGGNSFTGNQSFSAGNVFVDAAGGASGHWLGMEDAANQRRSLEPRNLARKVRSKQGVSGVAVCTSDGEIE